MRIRSLYLLSAILGLGLLLPGCAKKKPEPVIDRASLAMFAPLPEMAPGKEPITEEKVALGRMLYHDPRLSKSQKISCNTCHVLTAYGVDNEPTSEGHQGQRGDRNSPTVYNAAIHFAQFWDGRADDVEEQAKGPVQNPVEMAMPSEKHVVEVLRSIPGYVEAFQKAFPEDKDPVTFDNMARAIGAFERKLMTPSRWDRFLKGDDQALTGEEKAGFLAFMDAGCTACHSGALLGGNMFQRLGSAKPWPDDSDTGRHKVTGNEGDKFLFKVPSLRNIEKTGPYFHDGKVPTLDLAVANMADYQLGRTLSGEEIQSIVTWLKSLTGELPAELIQTPELPASGSATPGPSEAE